MERIAVPFEGPGAGIGPLAWGQQQVWAAMLGSDSSMPMGGVVPVTDGRTVEDIAAELRFFMSRYPAMRTLLHVDADGAATQEVFASGTAFLEVHDAADASAAARALESEWRSRNFDYASEWPLRMGVTRQDGVVTHVVVIVCHIAADLGGLAVMTRDLAGAPAEDAPAPLDLVRQQLSPSSARQTTAAMRYWESHLRAMPPSMFRGPVDRGDPVYARVRWESRAMHLATLRLGTDPGWVLLAAFATAFDRVQPGSGPFIAIGIIGNRFRPGLRDIVSPVTQDGLFVLDVTATTPAEAIARAQAASMSASKHAYYDPQARAALTARMIAERGEHLDLTCLYNDRRTPRPVPPEPADPQTALAETRILAEEPLRFLGPKLMLVVEDVPDVVRLSVDVDTRYLSLPDVRKLLHELESFTLEAAAPAQ